MKNRRVALGPTSPRGIYSRSMAAPGKSLDMPDEPVKKRSGGSVKSSASKRADGCAVRGKTRGKMVKMSKGGYC